MGHPILYEINTRCWLRELSQKGGGPVLLGTVPETELLNWQRLGFTHIWLMGVWPTGPLARAKALEPGQRGNYVVALPDWREEDVTGSPYAIAEYRVAEALGGEEGLGSFRRNLHQHGLKLLLDFVPNHLAVDHPWTRERPELFVQSTSAVPETFPVQTTAGNRWLAHGKDPYFPAWSDTAQLDYRRPATRQAMTELLVQLAARCDGVRCDMAMLLLNNVFARTWQRLPAPEVTPAEEFWGSAILNTKRTNSDFIFLAEAYWGLEPQLQALGFEYTYDKDLYDRLIHADGSAVRQHVFGLPAQVLKAGAHFLENHDEPRVASLVPFPRHRAAALLVLALPGMRFLHEGQLTGARLRIPVQLARRSPEPEQAEIKEMYERLLEEVQKTAVGKGQPRLLEAQSAAAGQPSPQACIVIQWQEQPSEFDLVVVNFSGDHYQCRVPLAPEEVAGKGWKMKDLLGSIEQNWEGQELAERGLRLELPPWAAELLHFASFS
jgi:hypothetical protein